MHCVNQTESSYLLTAHSLDGAGAAGLSHGEALDNVKIKASPQELLGLC